MRANGKHLDKYRKVHPTVGGSEPGALYGYYRMSIGGVAYEVISSGEASKTNRDRAIRGEAGNWEHVSVSVSRKADLTPPWQVMHYIKLLFWRPDELIVQYHPPETAYISVHPGTLHLWKPPYELMLPPSFTVGPVVTGSDI